jgi:transposase
MLYDYVCSNCGVTVEKLVDHIDDIVKCDKCKCDMSRCYPSSVNIDIFPTDGIHLEHVGPKGKTFYSKREMIKFANNNKLELGALL